MARRRHRLERADDSLAHNTLAHNTLTHNTLADDMLTDRSLSHRPDLTGVTMTTASSHFPPLIDLTDPDAPAQLDAACREVGFFQVTGHGIPLEILEAVDAAAEDFFTQPLDEKMRWASHAPEVERGYTAKGTEGFAYSLGLEQPPDLLEAYTMGIEPLPDGPAYRTDAHHFFDPNIWPDQPASLRAAMLAYYPEAQRVTHLITSKLALALGLSEDFFEPYTDASTDTLRINWFEGGPGEEALPGQFGIGPHTDYGIISVLFNDQAKGLQVYTKDEVWADVVPVPGALVVNVGDLLSRWTNDEWRSTLHRVMPAQGTGGRRRSTPFFHEGNFDALVTCIPTCDTPENPAKYEPITGGDHVLAKLMAARLLETADTMSTVGDRTAALTEPA
ncbi:2-oxoglutarate and iron-dependent oxygenase domain-containing protein [soil metagenome]